LDIQLLVELDIEALIEDIECACNIDVAIC